MLQWAANFEYTKLVVLMPSLQKLGKCDLYHRLHIKTFQRQNNCVVIHDMLLIICQSATVKHYPSLHKVAVGLLEACRVKLGPRSERPSKSIEPADRLTIGCVRKICEISDVPR